jgi:chorismate synthase
MSTLRFLTAGESHGPELTAILEGLPAGLPLDCADIDPDLARRQKGAGTGARLTSIEQDVVRILSGVMAGHTTGGPIALAITNQDHANWRGKPIPPFTVPRPGHADLAAAVKYGYDDARCALERASARETAARVAIGAICRKLLLSFKIRVGGYVVAVAQTRANVDSIPFEKRLELGQASDVGCPDPVAAEEMCQAIRRAQQQGETLGGIIEAVALGVPVGLGSFVHWDRRLDSRVAGALLSIPAMKGVEIGDAFANTRLAGTQAQDAITLGENGRLQRTTDRCGGIEAGLSNGEPIIVRVAMKPIPTTLQSQPSVDLASGLSTSTKYERSDTCPTPRGVVVVESMLCFVLAQALLEKLGGDSMAEIQPRFAALRQATLTDAHMSGQPRVYWP